MATDDHENLYLWVLEKHRFCCEKCGIQHGERSKLTRKNARVFVAHRDGNLQNFNPRNLMATCEVCYKAATLGAVQMVMI